MEYGMKRWAIVVLLDIWVDEKLCLRLANIHLHNQLEPLMKVSN